MSVAEQVDIIVTAQRYEQRLQDVPISVSAVTADQIAARGITASNLFDERAPLTRPFGAFFENIETQPRVVGFNIKARM